MMVGFMNLKYSKSKFEHQIGWVPGIYNSVCLFQVVVTKVRPFRSIRVIDGMDFDGLKKILILYMI